MNKLQDRLTGTMTSVLYPVKSQAKEWQFQLTMELSETALTAITEAQIVLEREMKK